MQLSESKKIYHILNLNCYFLAVVSKCWYYFYVFLLIPLSKRQNQQNWMISTFTQNVIFFITIFERVCIGQFVVNEIYSSICLRVFHVLWHLEILYHNRRHFHYRWLFVSNIVYLYAIMSYFQSWVYVRLTLAITKATALTQEVVHSCATVDQTTLVPSVTSPWVSRSGVTIATVYTGPLCNQSMGKSVWCYHSNRLHWSPL